MRFCVYYGMRYDRFITPLLGYLVATCKDPSVAVVVDGNDRMRVRGYFLWDEGCSGKCGI